MVFTCIVRFLSSVTSVSVSLASSVPSASFAATSSSLSMGCLTDFSVALTDLFLPITSWTIRITSFAPSSTTPGAWDLTLEATDGDLPVDMPVSRIADSIFVAPAVADLPSTTTRAAILSSPTQDASTLTFTVVNPDATAPSSFFCLKLED